MPAVSRPGDPSPLLERREPQDGSADSAPSQLFDLLLDRQPGLRILRHTPPMTENQPAPCGNGLLMMERTYHGRVRAELHPYAERCFDERFCFG